MILIIKQHLCVDMMKMQGGQAIPMAYQSNVGCIMEVSHCQRIAALIHTAATEHETGGHPKSHNAQAGCFA